jgi:hypothetical protein
MKKFLLCMILACSCLYAEEIKHERYLVTLQVKESHFTLNLMTHIKDSCNAMELTLPVDKKFFDSVQEGQKIDSSFKTASLIMRGSFGKYVVTVLKKEIVND